MNGNLASFSNSKKPKRGFVFCPECVRPKQLFKSEKEAELFIHYNQDTILDESGYCPVRSYYCEACGGWHVTSQSLEIHHDKKMADKKARLSAQHKKETIRRQNASKKLDQVEEYINIAVGNFRKNNTKKGRKHLQKAFHVFQQTMKSESFKTRKLALFSKLSVCYELWPA